MILHLSGDADYNMLTNLTKAYEGLKKEEKLHVYFTCPQGGYSDVAAAIIDFVNRCKQDIMLTFYGELFSAGMTIFLSTECYKEILKDTRGMFHFAWQEISISEGGKPSSDYDIFSMKEMKKSKIKTVEFLKTTKLNEKEITLIKKGKDVYFTHTRMQELI